MSEKKKNIRVFIVDDSALARTALRSILSSDPQLEVIGEAQDGREAVKKALLLKPDVITMDLEMPLLGGLEAIEAIMEEQPVPIVVVSSLDTKIVVRALSIGAMDFVSKTNEIDKISNELIEKVKIASRVRPLRRMRKAKPVKKMSLSSGVDHKIIALGISTGGPQALQAFLSRLPGNLPASIVVVQHISEGFVEGLVEWLNQQSFLDVKVAKEGDDLKAATVFFAPDKVHLTVGEEGRLHLKEDLTRKMIHVPSIDVLMKSASESFGKKAIGILMTGMGHDGVDGMAAIKKVGGYTLAQDEKSSAIFGMNKLAIEQGVVAKVVSLEKMSSELISLLMM